VGAGGFCRGLFKTVKQRSLISMENCSRPKIGAVSYLNTKPLVAGMDELGDEFQLVFDLPSRLADRLAAAELTVALIPVVEALHPDYTIVSDACIACRGPVRSVKLFSRVPGDQIRSLALDEGSRTSRILCQLLLAKRFSVRPQTCSLPMDARWQDADSDAILVIGDRAMNVVDDQFEFSWDLGEEWFRQTGLPFVFAVWAARSGPYLDHLDWLLGTCRDAGLEELDRIAANNASKYGLTYEECFRYLSQYLHFELGAAEKKGLELFFQEGAAIGLLPPQKLRFHECSAI